MSREETIILNFGVDRYALRACARHADRTVALCPPEPWDFGPIVPAERVELLRVDDHVNPASVLAALHRAGLAEVPFTAVHAADEWSQVTAGLLARHLGRPGIDPVVALRFRDKSLQKDRIRAAGGRTAPSVVIEDIHDVAHLDGTSIGKSVLKPVAGGGTADTVTVSSFADLSAFSRDYRARDQTRRTFLLEEFMPGEEWAADGVVFDGEVIFLALARYRETLLTLMERQHPAEVVRLDPDTDPVPYKLAGPVVETALAALGLTHGVFHMELFHDKGMVSYGECAARVGGAMTQEQVLCKFNVDLAECAVLCALGRRPDLDVRIRPEAVGITYLVGRPGVLISHPPLSEVLAQPNVEYARFDVPFGTTLPGAITNTGQNVGQLLVRASTEDVLLTRMAELRAWFDDRLVVAPPNPTLREHRVWQHDNWPDGPLGGLIYSSRT